MFPNTIHLHTAQACKRGVCLYIVALVYYCSWTICRLFICEMCSYSSLSRLNKTTNNHHVLIKQQQAVFAAGAEWEAALELILAFVRSKAPARGQERGELCPRWVPPVFVPSFAGASSPSSLQSVSVSSVSVLSSAVSGVEKYTTQSANVPKHHSPTHRTGV